MKVSASERAIEDEFSECLYERWSVKSKVLSYVYRVLQKSNNSGIFR